MPPPPTARIAVRYPHAAPRIAVASRRCLAPPSRHALPSAGTATPSAAAGAVNSSCRFSCTTKRGLERARHYRRPLPLSACRHARRRRLRIKWKPPVTTTFYFDGASARESPPYQCARRGLFINRPMPDHRKTRFYTWQSSVVAWLLQRSAQKSDPTSGFSFFDRACSSEAHKGFK